MKIKKPFFAFVILALLGLCFVSCQANTDDTDDTGDTEAYVCKDSNAFVEDWLQAQNGGDHSVLKEEDLTRHTVAVPRLVSEEFRFMYVEVNEYNYLYHYVPLHDQKAYFDYSEGIVVSVSREEDSFDIALRQMGLSAENGMAYDEKNNVWYLDRNGRRVAVTFPSDTVVSTAEALGQYFVFEEIASGE
ncbi:MAG: hypothetical protein IJY47_07425 [Clostridia bacterium]|nr:hypothetical protein [Clostridia bacterium]